MPRERSRSRSPTRPRSRSRSRSRLKSKEQKGKKNTISNTVDPNLPSLSTENYDSDETMKEDLTLKTSTPTKKMISQIIGTNPTDNLTIITSSTSSKRPASSPLDDSDNISKKKTTNSHNISTHISSLPTGSPNPIDNLFKNRYAQSNQGPFYVYVQSSSTPPSPIHPLSIGRILSEIRFKDVTEIKRLGFSKVSIRLKNKESTNLLVAQQPFKEKKCICFIPNYRIFRQGIIRNIPTDIELAELKSGIDSTIEVIELRRLNRKITTKNDSDETTTEFVPAKSIVLNFLNQALPKHIYIFSVRYEVAPFVPKTTICFSCLRFGHAASRCRGKPRCSHCGCSDHESSDLCPHKDSPPFCTNCKGEHSPLDPKCPEFQVQRNVQLLAAERNIPLKEARKILTGKIQPSNLRDDISEFPVLPNNTHKISPLNSSRTFSSPSSNHFQPILHSSSLSTPQRSYASAAASSTPPRKISLINRSFHNETLAPARSLPSSPMRTYNSITPPGHDYFIEPNGRSSLKSPNGCAFSPQNLRDNCDQPSSYTHSPPSGSNEIQLPIIHANLCGLLALQF